MGALLGRKKMFCVLGVQVIQSSAAVVLAEQIDSRGCIDLRFVLRAIEVDLA